MLMWPPQTQRKQGQARGKMLAPLLRNKRRNATRNECDRGGRRLTSDLKNCARAI